MESDEAYPTHCRQFVTGADRRMGIFKVRKRIIEALNSFECNLHIKVDGSEFMVGNLSEKVWQKLEQPGIHVTARTRGTHAIEVLDFLASLLGGSTKIAKMTKRISKTVTVKNSLGMHSRPLALFVGQAYLFESEIIVEKDGEKVDGREIMDIYNLCLGCGAKFTIHAIGPDAELAVAELADLVERRKFNE